MPEILLTTLNAKYAHAAFGLRYLMANLGPLRQRAGIVEFDINQRAIDVVEAILEQRPRIVGIGVYIWNAELSLQVVAMLKRIRPDLIVIVGGPEVSYETDQQEICALADYVITGEADLAFAELCDKLLRGSRPLMRVIPAELPQFDRLVLPYDLYTDEDAARRVIYVEASRGCPFKCEFCLSSLDVPVRNVPLDDFLAHMQRLLDRGVRQFKFVDRTFNLNLNFSRAILQFFLDRYTPDLFLHFEMIPDRLPEGLRELIARFPPGALQFEVGIQTFNEEVAKRISRRQDNARVADNFRFLREQTGVHIHADLIVGLPGEDLASFAAGFDRLVALGPQEIQVGILKRLRGTPITRHDAEWEMVYSPHPPYEVLSTKTMPFATLQAMRRFARYWDIVANSGRFVRTTPLLWTPPPGDDRPAGNSPFHQFMAWSEWLYERQNRRTHAIAQHKLAELLFGYLTGRRGHAPELVAAAMADDYRQSGSKDVPDILRPHLAAELAKGRLSSLPRRQARHMPRPAAAEAPAPAAAGPSEVSLIPNSEQSP